MSEDIGKLVLRVGTGVLILLHGIFKLQNGVDGVAGMLTAHGLPSMLAYGVYLGEVVAPVLVIIGLYTRIAPWSWPATWWWRSPWRTWHSFSRSADGGWALELQGMYLFASIAIALLGAGRLGVGGTAGRYN